MRHRTPEMLDFLDSAPQAEVLRKEARKPRMSLEHVNVERKLVEVKLFLWHMKASCMLFLWQPFSRLNAIF
jgi:hypothetical protein